MLPAYMMLCDGCSYSAKRQSFEMLPAYMMLCDGFLTVVHTQRRDGVSRWCLLYEMLSSSMAWGELARLELFDKSRCSKFDRLPIDEGIEPLKLLSDKSRYVKFIS